MSSDAHPQIRLQPEHLSTLAAFRERRVIGARLCRGGRFDPEGFALYGRLEMLAACGLVEFLARDGRRDISPGDVSLYYYLTDRGRDLIRWRIGAVAEPLNRSGAAPSYAQASATTPPPRA